MSRIVSRSLLEYFRPYYSEKVHPAYRKEVYYSGRRIFNKVTWLIGLMLTAVGIGFIDPHAHAVAGAVLAALLIDRFVLYRAAGKLTISRKVPAHATQGDKLEIVIEVKNTGHWTLRDLVVRDHFSGASDSQVVLWIDEGIAPGRSWKGTYRRVCDAGMGLHTFSDLSVTLADPAGVFEVTLQDETRTDLVIYPEPVPIPELPVTGQRHSFAHGKYDTRSRGGTSDFAGIRNYARGDSLRHVSWKATARMGKLMVKEYEAVNNTDVTIIVDMHAAFHAGTDSESSWELAKDAALSILAQQLANGNRVALYSQAAYVPAGGGENHLNLIAQSIFRLRPTGDKLDRIFRVVDPGTTAVYIGGILAPLRPAAPELLPGARAPAPAPARASEPPANGDAFAAVREQLLRLRVKRAQTICLLVDSASFVLGEALSGLDSHTVEALGATPARALAEKRTFLVSGARAYVLERGHSIGESLLQVTSAARREALEPESSLPQPQTNTFDLTGGKRRAP